MKILAKIEEYFLGILILLVSVILIINIFLREVFTKGIPWAEEFIRYGIIYITFIGMAVCFRKGIHVGVDLLMTSINDKNKKVLQIIINGLALLFMGLIVFYGIKLVNFSVNSGQITPSLNIKTWMVYLAIPIGGILSILHLIFNTIDMIRNSDHFEDSHHDESIIEPIKEG